MTAFNLTSFGEIRETDTAEERPVIEVYFSCQCPPHLPYFRGSRKDDLIKRSLRNSDFFCWSLHRDFIHSPFRPQHGDQHQRASEKPYHDHVSRCEKPVANNHACKIMTAALHTLITERIHATCHWLEVGGGRRRC